jgi:ribonucleoside-triphosphate reductase
MNKLIQEIQLADKYSRLKDDGTKETWAEVIDRVVQFLHKEIVIKQHRTVPQDWWRDIRDGMTRMDVLPSMRVVQMAGPALERDHVGAYNCAYLALDKPSALGELLHVMMQGTGVGFSVESRYVAQWPKVQSDPKYAGTPDSRMAPWTILDSTEGWVEAFRYCIDRAMEGIPVEFNYSYIRPAGSPLRIKGGYASGPDPLRDLLDFTTRIIRGAAGRQLRPIEVHRIATKAGSIVMVGGVRRAAQISLSDGTDSEMRDCKSGNFWLDYPELSMANNSGVFMDKDQVSLEWPFLRSSGTGERGLFNPNGPVPLRRLRTDFGTNPCGEILLRSRQFCNLSIAVARPGDTEQSLGEKVRIATLVGTLQSCLTDFPHLPREWRKNCEDERLLGVDITGTMDCPLLQQVNDETRFLLDRLKGKAVRTNEYASKQLGITSSVAVTCNKPSGNSSQLLDSSSGIHPRYAEYYIRRLRLSRDTPLSAHLRSMGVPVFPEVGHTGLDTSPVWVFELPAKSPDGAITRDQVTALSQLEYWKMWKLYWTEHNPSCTIYVGEDEWDIVHQWVRDNWDIIGGLSFLPRDNHIYQLAPYEEITEDEFQSRVQAISWSGGSLAAWAGEQAGSTDAACAGDFCEF